MSNHIWLLWLLHNQYLPTQLYFEYDIDKPELKFFGLFLVLLSLKLNTYKFV